MEPMSAPTLVLISGFARAGKDTLAEGILEWSRRPSRKTSFSAHLKDAANDFLWSLNLEGDFHNEAFKVKHRDLLVTMGKFARSMNPDVFAENLAHFVPIQMGPDEVAPETVVVSDWRYINELRVSQSILWNLGWKVRTVYVATAGVGPANDEELDSICEIKQYHSFDQEFVFAPNSRQCILAEGRHLAKTWNL
jgi:hypothetical protein